MSVSKIVEKTESEVQWANVTVNDLTVFGDLTVAGEITTPAPGLLAQIPNQTLINNPSGVSIVISAPSPSVPLTYLYDPNSDFDLSDFNSGRLIFNKIGIYKVTLSLGNCITSNISLNTFGNYGIQANLHEQFNGVGQTTQSQTLSQPLFTSINFATAPPVSLVSSVYTSLLHEFTFNVTSDVTLSFKPFIQFLIKFPAPTGNLDFSQITPFGSSILVNNLQVTKL